MTSYQRRCDVITSHRRWYDVILTLCAHWVGPDQTAQADLNIRCPRKTCFRMAWPICSHSEHLNANIYDFNWNELLTNLSKISCPSPTSPPLQKHVYSNILKCLPPNKKYKFSDKHSEIFPIYAQKNRLWVLVRTASARRFYRVPTIYGFEEK